MSNNQITVTGPNVKLIISRDNMHEPYDHVVVECDPSYSDQDVLVWLRALAAEGAEPAKLALEITDNDLYDFKQVDGIHGARRLYAD